MNGTNKKAAIIVLAAVAAIISVIAVISVTKKHGGSNDKKTTPTPSVAATPAPTPGGKDDLENNDPTPTPIRTDYSGETIEFTNEMPDLVFSHGNYFYNSNQDIRLYSRFGGEIYYTTDGSSPSKESNRYNHSTGISLKANTGSIPKVYSLRAAAFYEDGTQSEEFVHTYVLGTKVDSRFQLTVFAVNGDPAELTDGPDGILYGENYNQRGRASERPVYLEILNPDGTPVSAQKCGVRVHGAYNRQNSQKSMKFAARKEYSPESGTFYLNLLDAVTQDGSATQIVRYDKFVLRASGNDFRFAFIRDELNQMLAADAGFPDYEAVKPAVCYINGTYFGFFWIHPSYCDTYLKNMYGDTPAERLAAQNQESDEPVNEGEFVILEGGDAFKLTDDSDELVTEWAKKYDDVYCDYAFYKDLTDDAVYRELSAWMDVENYLSYMAYNIYVCNKDWPHNNYRCYRYIPADGEPLGTGVYDGRWRYMLHDIDYSYGLYNQREVMANYDTLRDVLNKTGERYCPLLDALLKRDDCKEYFVKMSLDYGNGALSAENVNRMLDSMQDSRSSEMSYYFNYLSSLGKEDVEWVNESQLISNLQTIRDFASARPSRSVSFLKSKFILGDTFRLTIDACDNAQLTVNSYTAPANQGFSGTYFNEYSTTVSLTCKRGYRFDYWDVNGVKNTSAVLTLTEKDIADGAVNIVPHVTKMTDAGIYIDTIQARENDYILLANPSDSDCSVAGYKLSDGSELIYEIPAGTTIPANGTLTIYCANAEPAGDALKCEFSLSKGETLTLTTDRGTVADSVAIPNLHVGFVYCRDLYTDLFRECVPDGQ